MRFTTNLLAAGTIITGLLASLTLVGCGTPGAPQPPSLRLPRPIEDLTATRAAGTVTLHWTTPQKTTDRLLIQGLVTAVICRREVAEPCQPAGKITLTAGALGDFQDTLPAKILVGSPRPLTYSVELENSKGHSAGPSNPAVIVGGAAPGAILSLSAEVRADGVALRWNGEETTPVRLHRLLLTTTPPNRKPVDGPSSTATEPPLRDLIVESKASESGASGALDTSARFGQSYEYTAQRIVRVPVAGKTLELPGVVSAPVRVNVLDTFPPSIPQGLAAVLVPNEKTIDLSWQPDTEPDLAGYIVYRIQEGAGDTWAAHWTRISGPQPIASSAYRDTTIEPGHHYQYSVTAIDQTGHESQRSPSASESVPNP